MLFRLVLLATLAWYTTFCVANDGEKKESSARKVQLELNDLGAKQHRWSVTTIVDSEKRTSPQISLANPQDDEPGYPWAECNFLTTGSNTGPKPNPKTTCHLKVGCKGSLNNIEWPICLVSHAGKVKRLTRCGKFTETYVKDNLPACDAELDLIEQTVIPIQSDHGSGAFKQVTLFQPKTPDRYGRPDRFSKKVKAGADTFFVSCQRLLAWNTASDEGTCVVSVYCYDKKTRIEHWAFCLAILPTDSDPLGSLGRCGPKPPQGIEHCALDDSFKEAELQSADENEC